MTAMVAYMLRDCLASHTSVHFEISHVDLSALGGNLSSHSSHSSMKAMKVTICRRILSTEKPLPAAGMDEEIYSYTNGSNIEVQAQQPKNLSSKSCVTFTGTYQY